MTAGWSVTAAIVPLALLWSHVSATVVKRLRTVFSAKKVRTHAASHVTLSSSVVISARRSAIRQANASSPESIFFRTVAVWGATKRELNALTDVKHPATQVRTVLKPHVRLRSVFSASAVIDGSKWSVSQSWSALQSSVMLVAGKSNVTRRSLLLSVVPQISTRTRIQSNSNTILRMRSNSLKRICSGLKRSKPNWPTVFSTRVLSPTLDSQVRSAHG